MVDNVYTSKINTITLIAVAMQEYHATQPAVQKSLQVHLIESSAKFINFTFVLKALKLCTYGSVLHYNNGRNFNS